MRVLILGGTEFAGRAVAESALARGRKVTVFHRGRHEAPDGVTELLGDRTAPDGLAALAEGEWDVVIDTWSAAPWVVRDSARLLAGRVGRYVYVSSCSVYAWPPEFGYDETSPVVEGSPDAGDVPYAEAKRGGELAAVESFGDDGSLLVRAGLILGPWENIGRLPWWLNRVARGGPVLAPGPRETPLQYIDVRDLADWTLSAAERGLGGAYNVVSGRGHTTMGELLETCVRVVGSGPGAGAAPGAELRWTAPEVVLGAGIEPWTDLPIWIPREERAEMYAAIHAMSVTKAVTAGLSCRPVGNTVADTWAWLRARGGEAPRRADRPGVGLPPEVEAKLLGG